MLSKFKESEKQMNEKLYNGLCLLKRIYKPSGEWDILLRMDMFAKIKQFTLYELLHYLFDILNPKLTKERLTSWRPLDNKMQNTFRTETVAYISEINNLYCHAHIPPIRTSDLIVPAGTKTLQCMFKLSQLVISEFLKKQSISTLLYCPVPAYEEKNSNKLTHITSKLESDNKEMFENFEDHYQNRQLKANSTSDKLIQLNVDIDATKKHLYKLRVENPKKGILKNRLTALCHEWHSLAAICSLFEDCKELVHYLNTTNLVIDLNDGNTNQELQDLTKLGITLTSIINFRSLEMPLLDTDYIQQNSEIVQELIEIASEIKEELLTNKQQISFSLLKLQKAINEICF